MSQMGFGTGLRTARAQAIIDHVGTNYKLAIYDGTRPATGGAATTQLYRGTSTAVLGTAAGATVVMSLPADSAGLATGTAVWGRLFKTDGTTIVLDCGVGVTTSTELIKLNSLVITSGVNVSITAGTLTEGNA